MIQFFLASVLSLAPSPVELPQAARAALERATRTYSDGSAHAAAFTQTYTPAGFASARKETGTVWIQAPQRLRFDYSAPEKKVFTYDDGEGRFYSPEDRQLNVKKLSPEERARLPIIFLSDSAELARGYAISTAPGPDGSLRLDLAPRELRPELSALSFTVASGGTIADLSYADDAGNRTEFRFEGWRTEKPRRAEDYRVTGPKGTRVVE